MNTRRTLDIKITTVFTGDHVKLGVHCFSVVDGSEVLITGAFVAGGAPR